ncbi:MAG: hypothetical protein ACXVWT_01085 [Solirubrobacteraceae bacterium]
MSPRVATVLLSATGVLALAGCGAGATSTVVTRATRSAARTVAAGAPTTPPTTTAPRPNPAPPPPSHPRLLAAALGSSPTAFVPAVSWRGHTAVWIGRSPSGIALLSFDQRLVELRLYSGTVDAGGSGWRFGPAVLGRELGRLVAAFNGGFKFSTGAGGFESYGRLGAPLGNGLGSIVTYTNGRTDIGAWNADVPAAGTPVASVRQNLTLLINNGTAAASIDCISCWGATLGGVSDPARSALGITADGRLVWAGGEHLTPSELAAALLGARVVRAVELDINPEWVAGYLYGHRGGVGPLAPVPVVPGQNGVPGFFLAPYSRDFFTIEAR